MKQLNKETERKIFLAARKIFQDKGKDGARMQEIADEAGINKALLHYYFRSKDRLFEEIFKIEIQQIVKNMVDAISETPDVQTFLKVFIQNYLNNLYEKRKLIRFVLWESHKQESNVGILLVEQFKKQGFPDIPVIIRLEKAVKQGEIKAVNIHQLVLNILAMCIFPFVAKPIISRILPQIEYNSDLFLKTRSEEIFNYIWNTIKPDNTN